MIYVFLILIGVLLRFLPHMPNFAPITAIALFAGVYLPKKYILILPIITMLISDYFLGFSSTTLFVYFSFLISGVIGILIRKIKNPGNIIKGSLVSSLQFFIITNFGVWLATNMYPKTVEGLMFAYSMGVPFFRGTLLGDLFFTGVLFVSYEIAIRAYSRLKLGSA